MEQDFASYLKYRQACAQARTPVLSYEEWLAEIVAWLETVQFAESPQVEFKLRSTHE